MKKVIAYTFCAGFVLGIVPTTFAMQTSYAKNDNGNHYGQIKNGNNGNHYGQINQTAAQESTPSQGKLEGKKLTLCQNKETALKTTMQQSASQAQHQLDVFKSIADRTRAFYRAEGHTDADYSTLSSDARVKYDAAKEIIGNLSAQSFSCSDSEPKQILITFRDAVTAKNQALEDYRRAVKDLILSVKSAQIQSTHQIEAR